MNIAGTGLMVGVALLGGGVIVLDRLALKLIRPRKRLHSRNVRDLPFHAHTHSFTSSMGQRLKGWVLTPETDNGGAVAVLAHGWGSSHGRMTLLARPLLERGHPVFLFDVRHHGEAPEARYVTARHFRDDILAGTTEMTNRYPDRPLVLIGHSMGGSAGILSVAEGAPVDGLVTISAPADLFSVWAEHLDKSWLPGALVVRLLTPFWRTRARVSFDTLRPDQKVRDLTVPVLVIHGAQDKSVDSSHARILADGAGVEALILEGAGHNELLGSPEVVTPVLAFLGGAGRRS